jgi:hypothetical protein
MLTHPVVYIIALYSSLNTTTVGEQQNDELVDSYLMKFERFIHIEWSIQKIHDQQCHVIM